MEQKKTILNYIGQLFATYGIIVTIFIVFVSVVGENAKDLSSLYQFGNQGLALDTLVQLLMLACIVTLAQILYLTDQWIKNMNIILRNILFFATICVVMGVFVAIFVWFPINNVKAWVAFAVSFVICTCISVFISKLQENAENKKMEQALEKFKEK